LGTYTIEFTPQAERWIMNLNDTDFRAIAGALDLLEARGPTLGRPAVDRIKGSRHHNMKELRAIGGTIRALFAFNPERTALVLVGGDKRHDWTGWYERNVPIADRLFDKHLAEVGRKSA
jgi:hypothetical protein